MPATAQNVPSKISSAGKISTLVVSSFLDDFETLRSIFHHGNWLMTHCTRVQDIDSYLVSVCPMIVACERQLADGNWKDVLRKLQAVANAPQLLVCSRHADEELWAEVLNLGGYDVLLKPYDRAEVTRVFGMAWRSWCNSFGQILPGGRVVPQCA